jgi:hypothetical protein
MLFTTFLFATAVATAAVLGSMLLGGKKDAERTHVSPAFLVVAAAAAALTALGFVMV